MVRSLPRISFFAVILFSIVLFLTGCQQKEKPADEEKAADTTAVIQDTLSSDTTAQQAPQDTLMDLKGKWSGSFANRGATLNITSQDGVNFSGTVTVNFRERWVKAVSGSFNKDDMSFSMNDTEHSRIKGVYKGKLSENGKMNGTFTSNVDGEKANFTFTKR